MQFILIILLIIARYGNQPSFNLPSITLKWYHLFIIEWYGVELCVFYSIIWSDTSTDLMVAVKWRIATSNKWMNQSRIHVAFSVDQKLQVSENAIYAFHESAIRIMLHSDFDNKEKVLDVNVISVCIQI